MSVEDKQTARIRVLVRCRPPIQTEESKRSNRILVNSQANAIVVRDELSTWSSDARQFDFDRVFDMHQSQSVVFDEVKPLISHVLNGFHATIFAYGQTGSGKTYTMEGLNYRLVSAEPAISRTLPSTSTSTKKTQLASETSLSLSSSLLSSSVTSTSELLASAGNHVPLHKSQPTQREWESSMGVEADVAHTPVEQHGIVPRIIQLLFDEARCREQDNVEEEEEEEEKEEEELQKERSKTCTHESVRVKYSFKCSYYQIYNEKITDLLRPSPARSWQHQHQKQQQQYYSSQYHRYKPQSEQGYQSRYVNADNDGLRLRWHDGDKFTVENLFQCECNDAATMRRVFFSGVQEKVMGSHGMNWQSSRSHCVFTIYVCCSNALSNEVISRSELSLVDLAGSEKLRQMSSQPSSRLLRESIEINTSLLTLGKVITALATNSNNNNNHNNLRSINSANSNYSCKPEKRPLSRSSPQLNNTWQCNKVVHVPYRESKLTKLLKHALGGNSLTVMIACINPCDEYVEETLSTLLYAGKARRITNVLHLNEEPTRAVLQQLRAEIAQLKTELAYYRTLAQHTVAQETTEVHEIKEKAQKSHTELGEEQYKELCEELSEEEKEQHLEQELKTMHEAIEPKNHNGYQVGRQNNLSSEKEELQKETNQLADALISACEMLQKIISVNKELREAYDVVKQSNHEALRREAELNAENMTLRERVSTLEQIVLNNTFVNQSVVSEVTVNKTAEPHNAVETVAAPVTIISEATKPAVVTLTSSSESFLKSTRSASPSSSSLDFVRLQHNDNREQICSPDVNVLPDLHEHLTDSRDNSCDKKENIDSNAELSMPESSVKQVHNQLGKVEKSNSAKEKLTSETESTSMALSNEANSISTSLHSELSLSSVSHKSHHKTKHKENENHMHTSTTKGSNKTKHVSRLSNLLEAYMTKYKHPTKSANYEEYYQLEARKLAQSSPAQETMERVNELLRTTNVECDVQTLIPQSMLRTRTFGKLAFGGANDERDVFEQKRAEREERRRALLQRQQELYTAVHENIHGHTSATKDSLNNNNINRSCYNALYDRSNRHVSVKRNGAERCENIDQKQFAKTMELPRVRCAEDNTISTPHKRSTEQLHSACINDSISHARVHIAQTPMLTKVKELLYKDDDESNDIKYSNSNQCSNVNFKSNRYDANIKRTEQLSQGKHNNKKDSNANHVAQLLRYLNQDKY